MQRMPQVVSPVKPRPSADTRTALRSARCARLAWRGDQSRRAGAVTRAVNIDSQFHCHNLSGLLMGRARVVANDADDAFTWEEGAF